MQIAQHDEEIVEALRLVHDAYVEAGLMEPNRHRMRVTRHHLLPTTEVIVAMERDKVVGSVSLVGDGRLGLPLETLYSGEVRVRRRKGIRVVEASCFADRGGAERIDQTVLPLISMATQCAKDRGADELLSVVHPRHARFYRRYFGFQIIGQEKSYRSVNGQPAVPIALDLHGLAQQHPAGYQRMFGVPFDHRAMAPRRSSEKLRECLRAVVDEHGIENGTGAGQNEKPARVGPLEGAGLFESLAFGCS